MYIKRVLWIILLCNNILFSVSRNLETIEKSNGIEIPVEIYPIRISKSSDEDKVEPITQDISETLLKTVTKSQTNQVTPSTSLVSAAHEPQPTTVNTIPPTTTATTTIPPPPTTTIPPTTTTITEEPTEITTTNPTTEQFNTTSIVSIQTTFTETPSDTVYPTTTLTPPINNCHNICHSMTNQSTFTLSPDTNYLIEESSIILSCHSPVSPGIMSASIVWLFESVNPPAPQCSLTNQETLNLCSGFEKISDVDDQTDEYVNSTLTIKNLKPGNTGNYMCQIKVSCCKGEANEHEMSHLFKTRLIIESLYKAELTILGVTVSILLVIVITGNVFLQRRRKNKYTALSSHNEVKINNETVHHIITDVDEFDDNWNMNSDEEP